MFLHNKKGLNYYGHNLHFHEAPAPSDIFWENMHVTSKKKRIKRFCGIIMSLLIFLLCLAGIIIFGYI